MRKVSIIAPRVNIPCMAAISLSIASLAACIGWQSAEVGAEFRVTAKPAMSGAIKTARPVEQPLKGEAPPASAISVEEWIMKATTPAQMADVLRHLKEMTDSREQQKSFTMLWQHWLALDAKGAVDHARGLPFTQVQGLMCCLVQRHPDIMPELLAADLGLDPRIVADSARGPGIQVLFTEMLP
jgi:hypothetical protein